MENKVCATKLFSEVLCNGIKETSGDDASTSIDQGSPITPKGMEESKGQSKENASRGDMTINKIDELSGTSTVINYSDFLSSAVVEQDHADKNSKSLSKDSKITDGKLNENESTSGKADCNGDSVSVNSSTLPTVNSSTLPTVAEVDTKTNSEVTVPFKKKQKARKSCQSSSSYNNSYGTIASSPKSSSLAQFSKKTIKVTELESVLGIQKQSLNKMDAKTLDKLVLQKAQQQMRAREERDRRKEMTKAKTQAVLVRDNNKPDDKTNKTGPIPQGSRLKDVGNNQLITQFMTKKMANPIPIAEKIPTDKNSEIVPQDLKTVILNGPKSMEEFDSAHINGEVLNVKSEADKQDCSISTGTVSTGLSAVITGQMLLNKSKKKTQKRYRGRSGNYKLPGEKKFKKIKQRDSEDLAGSLAGSSFKRKRSSVRTPVDSMTDESTNTSESEQHKRRSSRKRKLTAILADDSQWEISTETDDDLIEKSSHKIVMKKRRKASSDVHTEDSLDHESFKLELEMDELPDLTPVKSVLDHSSNDARSPPEIGPAVRSYSAQQIESQAAGKDSSAALTQEISTCNPFKYMNTPNGMSYPVTPPETPESTISSIDDKVIPMVEKDKELSSSPACFCKLPGTMFKNNKPLLYCQALDSIDGKMTGCMKKVSSPHVYRSSSQIPFLAMCDGHRQRLKLHQCCPGCGCFCTRGSFYQCKDTANGGTVHACHWNCHIYKDDKYFCPHCGEQSAQIEVYLEQTQTNKTASGGKQEKKHVNNARMGGCGLSSLRRASTDSTHSKHSNYTTDESQLNTTGIKPILTLKTVNNKEICIKNVPMGMNKKELEIIFQQMQCEEEKKKKFRASNKNLYQAAKSGDLERVLYLLSEGFDPNAKFDDQRHQTALHVAASKGNLTLVHLLTQAGATPHVIDEDLRTVLMEAAVNGHTAVVKYLLKLGAVPDSRSSDGMTALHLAAQSGAVDCIKHIVQTGIIDVNIKDDGGWTPIIWAAEHRHIDCVRFLLEVGADPNLRDNEDNIGLHWAVFSGSTDIAGLFLNACCDMEAANEHGDRPLHIAARQDHYECVVLLIARGADSTARNNRNETPVTCCYDTTSPSYLAIHVNQQLKKLASQIRRPEKLLHRDISCGKEPYPIPIVNEYDDENYPTDYVYVNEYVETSPINVNRVITSLQSCGCQDNCSSLFCTCGRNSVRCWYTKEGVLPDEFNFVDPPLIFECNRACKCWANCQNRVIQLGISARLQVYRAPGKGWGVRSLLDIPKGSYVCEYIGEVLSDAEADKREDDSYLFDLDNRESDSYCIDARQYGNVSRFINHRCHPNLSPIKLFVNHQDLRFPRICFFANQDIKAYQELGFDYGDKFWVIKYKQFTCTCDSAKCRYNKDSIHKTVEEYYQRLKEIEEADSD